MLNLDTHIFLRAVDGTLSSAEDRVLRHDGWSISAIVLWEIAKLAQLGRIPSGLEDPVLAQAVSSVLLWPITVDICREIPRLDFRGDPADELIASTSIVHNVPLVTRDGAIRRSKLVPLAR